MSNTLVQDSIRAHALDQVGAAYIMGATAEPCTPKYRRALANGRSSDYADKIIDNCPVLSGKQSSCDGCQWQGELSYDCAQFSKFSAAAGGVSLPSGSNSQWTKVDWAVAGEIASLPMDVVCFVFHHNDKTGRKSHVGVYLGDGTVADARGHDYRQGGVMHKDVASYPWTHYAIPYEVAREAGFDMSERPTYAEMRRDTIRKGAKGPAVSEAQGLLNAWDETLALEVDGKFGSATQAAVEAFQAANGLKVDGIVGPNTWCVLLKIDVEPGEDDPELDEPLSEPNTPTIADLAADVQIAMDNLISAVQALLASVQPGGEEHE